MVPRGIRAGGKDSGIGCADVRYRVRNMAVDGS